MIDIIKSVYGKDIVPEKKILDNGYVRLIDVMPRLVPEGQTCDQAIVQAARVSYGNGTKTVNEDRGLIRYLLRHSHTTPFEMVEFKWQIKLPIFVARQWIRHRTASVNEVSGRYSNLPNEFYVPTNDNVRLQSKTNKQCSDGAVDSGDSNWFLGHLQQVNEDSYKLYEEAIEKGIGKEQARMLLPVNLYTEFYWKIDLHNLLHFLKLRCDKHAQYEIRVFAQEMLNIVEPLAPWTIEAWNDYDPYRGAIKLSRLELEKLKEIVKENNVDISKYELKSGNKREDAEWQDKLRNLTGGNNE